jgi:hypothetical protein
LRNVLERRSLFIQIFQSVKNIFTCLVLLRFIFLALLVNTLPYITNNNGGSIASSDMDRMCTRLPIESISCHVFAIKQDYRRLISCAEFPRSFGSIGSFSTCMLLNWFNCFLFAYDKLNLIADM